MRPLEGITVLDLSQFLSAPSATLRLADLGARVIKVERPGTGDICRTLYISNCVIDGDSSLFHAINRNKQSVALDLKDPASRPTLERLVRGQRGLGLIVRPCLWVKPQVRHELAERAWREWVPVVRLSCFVCHNASFELRSNSRALSYRTGRTTGRLASDPHGSSPLRVLVESLLEHAGHGRETHDDDVVDDGHDDERLERAVRERLDALGGAHHVHEADRRHER